MPLPLRCSTCVLRRWTSSDAESLARNADDPGVAQNLRDAFPHPYTLEDARRFLTSVAELDPPNLLAIEVDGDAAGGIGVKLGTDVERVGAEIGYWLGRPYWGRGIVTDAVRAMTAYALETFSLTRVFALPFCRNAPSARVLEKAGYVLEGRMKKSAIKAGELQDQFLYAFVP